MNRERTVEEKITLEHIAVPGYEFMPYGWCGECETCATMPCKDVCLACSYTETGDLKMPVEWPCIAERNREYNSKHRV